jgi:hypothetical protein
VLHMLWCVMPRGAMPSCRHQEVCVSRAGAVRQRLLPLLFLCSSALPAHKLTDALAPSPAPRLPVQAFMHWSEAQHPGWVEQHVESWANIAGTTLGLPKAATALLSGVYRGAGEAGRGGGGACGAGQELRQRLALGAPADCNCGGIAIPTAGQPSAPRRAPQSRLPCAHDATASRAPCRRDA